jgi:hypothetical protein
VAATLKAEQYQMGDTQSAILKADTATLVFRAEKDGSMRVLYGNWEDYKVLSGIPQWRRWREGFRPLRAGRRSSWQYRRCSPTAGRACVDSSAAREASEIRLSSVVRCSPSPCRCCWMRAAISAWLSFSSRAFLSYSSCVIRRASASLTAPR